jgi:hypothetical protein
MQLPEIGQYQVQIFVSVTLVLGGVLVALICDYLKGNNELLREQNRELKAHSAEIRRRARATANSRTFAVQQPLAVAAPAGVPSKRSLPAASMQEGAMAAIAAPVVAAPVAAPVMETTPAMETTRVDATETAAVPEATEGEAKEIGDRVGSAVDASMPRRRLRANGAARRPISADAMAAMERGAARAFAKQGMAATVAETARVTEIPLPVGVTSAAAMSESNNPREEQPAVEVSRWKPQRPAVEASKENFTPVENQAPVSSGQKRNWNELLAQRSAKASPAAAGPSSPSQLRQGAVVAASQAVPPAISHSVEENVPAASMTAMF